MLFSARDGQIYMTGAIFRPHPNSNPINTNLNPNPNNPNHNHTPRMEIAWSKSNYQALGTENITYDITVLVIDRIFKTMW